jgi:hypothetical protein
MLPEPVAMDTRALLYRLLYDSLIEMRSEACDERVSHVFRLADLFHMLPLRLERMARGEITDEEVMSDLRAHAERIGMAHWLSHRIQEDMK